MDKIVRLLASSAYLPGKPIPFDEINAYLGPFTRASEKIQKWVEKVQPIIKEMLGINYCYYAFNNKTRSFDDDNLSMSVKVAKQAIADAGLQAGDIDLLIYGGAYSHQLPPISTRIQEALGIKLCGEFQIHANCTSVYKAIKLAHILLQNGEYRNALVVSSMVSSACFLPEFYNQEKIMKEDIFLRWYLCDGAGALVLSGEDIRSKGFYLESTYVESAGGNKVSAMYNQYPNHWNNPLDDYNNCAHHIRQLYLNELRESAYEENEKTIFYNALNRMLIAKKIDLTSLKYLVINMPSKPVREMIIKECEEINITPEKCYSAIETMGYAGPPAAIISLAKLVKEQQFKDGEFLISFVMEASKFMQAGFVLKYYA